MKITIDSKTNEIKVRGKSFDELPEEQKNVVLLYLDTARRKGKLSEYDEDSMWMSYRYCIGRHTIAAHHRAGEIGKHCYGRMSDERSIFTAYDINKEIENQLMHCAGVTFYFPCTTRNRIYTSALDIFCEFVNDYEINSKEDLLKYKAVNVKLSDNERGYALEVITWEEYKEARFKYLCEQNGLDPNIGPVLPVSEYSGFGNFYKEIEDHEKKHEYFYMSSVDDLFVWNDLVHLFDKEHHHKSLLTDGTEVEWFWTYDHDNVRDKDGIYRRKDIGYRKIRVPVNEWNGVVKTYIPDECIVKDIY